MKRMDRGVCFRISFLCNLIRLTAPRVRCVCRRFQFDQPQILRFDDPTFYVAAAQEGLQYRVARFMLGNQPVAGFPIHDEGVVQAGFDAVIELPFAILAERGAAGAELVEQVALRAIFEPPAAFVQARLRDVERLLVEEGRELFDGRAGLPRVAAEARIGVRPVTFEQHDRRVSNRIENGGIAEVDQAVQPRFGGEEAAKLFAVS